MPTEEMLLLALSDQPREQDALRSTIRDLNKNEGILYFRGKLGGYCLWSHTSVNLHEKYQEAEQSLPSLRRVSEAIRGRLDARPLVARRHYIETGNLRSFEVVYCSPDELEARSKDPITQNDCRIVIPLCETIREENQSREFARAFKVPEMLIGIPRALSGLDGLVKEVERWEWIKNNTPELKDDGFAAQEVAQKLEHAKDVLERRVQHFVGLRHSDSSMSLRWFRMGREHTFASGHRFLSWLSDICEDLFPQAPEVRNELINRRNLSSAAARARMKLVELMFKSGNQPLLGMDKAKRPPEMSMYFSVLQNTNIHRQAGLNWFIDFPEPDDPAKLLAPLEAIRSKLQSAPDSRILVSDVFEMLRMSPYGVRDGLMPLLLVVVLLKHERDIALYENGTFLSEIAHEEILRLSKSPREYALQWCHIGGLRLTVFERLLEILGGASSTPKKAELLDVVKPLMRLAADLPLYARNTKTLSKPAIAVRETLLSAGDPTAMLFRDLPKACGHDTLSAHQPGAVDPGQAQAFVEALQRHWTTSGKRFRTFWRGFRGRCGRSFIWNKALRL